jgi:hypothetical protein
MAEQSINTSWLWQAGDGINGLKINQERSLLEWYDSIGCACGDSTDTQSYAEFLAQGPKFSSIPDDVAAEVQESLAALGVGG